ncbi:MAG: hypothetical protein ACI9SB_002563, partial [Candidatus Azotimanducaceae bacterium]
AGCYTPFEYTRAGNSRSIQRLLPVFMRRPSQQ